MMPTIPSGQFGRSESSPNLRGEQQSIDSIDVVPPRTASSAYSLVDHTATALPPFPPHLAAPTWRKLPDLLKCLSFLLKYVFFPAQMFFFLPIYPFFFCSNIWTRSVNEQSAPTEMREEGHDDTYMVYTPTMTPFSNVAHMGPEFRQRRLHGSFRQCRLTPSNL
jgi:hypothetical protein